MLILFRTLTAASLGLTLLFIWNGYSQRSALTLRQTQPTDYPPRHGTALSGSPSSSGVWIFIPSRAEYGEFRGGGPGAGGK